MPIVLGVALGGAVGASARYAVDRLIEQHTVSLFPWATFTVNVTGCFLIGVLTEAFVDRHHLPAWIRVGLIMGVIGGYTTFSTFAQETQDLVDARELLVALVYVAGSVVVGVLAAWAGGHVGRAI